ncbi:hypothetical protein HBB16_10970 [Pseudonocardia sp. MCCB 268]|nr:hypothetical protein [Pseudonocardia cytotoxica]
MTGRPRCWPGSRGRAPERRVVPGRAGAARRSGRAHAGADHADERPEHARSHWGRERTAADFRLLVATGWRLVDVAPTGMGTGYSVLRRRAGPFRE